MCINIQEAGQHAKLKLTMKMSSWSARRRTKSLVNLTPKSDKVATLQDRDSLYVVYVERRLETRPDFGALQLVRAGPPPGDGSSTGIPSFEKPHLFDFVDLRSAETEPFYIHELAVPASRHPYFPFRWVVGSLTNFDFADYQRSIVCFP